MKKVKLKSESTGLFQNIKQTTAKGLSGRFIFPPFSVLNTRDALWMRRKKQWVSLGIQSELGRGENLSINDPNLNDMDVYRHKERVASFKNQIAQSDFQKNKKPYAKVFGIGNKTEWEQGLLHKGKTIDTKNGETWDGGSSAWQNSGTSIFDPVLCELMYSWFCPENGQVVDPFAGGSVRGIVASVLGLNYWGCDLSEKQIEANKIQGEEITPNLTPNWVIGDSMKTLRNAPEADFVFSCPPYGDLEVYSDLEEDLSTKSYEGFLGLYGKIIKKACHKLKENRFACFVVGNFRDKKTGFYYDLVGDTVRLFEDSGLHYYNEAILITAIGSLPVRAGKVFAAGRKLGKTHQNILVFYKGDNHSKIKEIYK